MFGLSKKEAAAQAKKALKMLDGKGWKVRLIENQGWHWELLNGGLSLHSCDGGETFFCMIAGEPKDAGAGEIFWSNDYHSTSPMACVKRALQVAKDVAKRHMKTVNDCYKNIYGR